MSVCLSIRPAVRPPAGRSPVRSPFQEILRETLHQSGDLRRLSGRLQPSHSLPAELSAKLYSCSPVRMVTPDMTKERPRKRRKLKQPGASAPILISK
jgi:hypothetical protein